MKLADIDHTHPYTDRAFGETVAFERGTVAADGGAPDSAPEADEDTMRDVDHTSPHSDGADRAFERGTEGRDETV